jgi:hypothetical protein
LPNPYLSLPGEIVGAPPYFAEGVLMQGWFLRGSREAQQDFVDQSLNLAAGGALNFQTITDDVLVTAIYCDTMGSTDPVDAKKGVTQEWDVAFWTAVRGGRNGDEANWRIYWLPSFMFVDSTWAMASGREIFGYPKTTATFANRTLVHDDPTVTISAANFPVFSPTERPVTGPLVTVTLAEPEGVIGEILEDVGTAFDLFGDFLREMDGFKLPAWPQLSMPQILIRQSRDPVRFDVASSQSVLCVAPAPVRITGLGLLRGTIEVAITASASHPIMPTLGLAPSQQGRLGLWLTQDFNVGPAEILA